MISLFFPKSCPIIQVFFQLFKIYFPIFQVRQVNICPESCKRSQIYAGCIPAMTSIKSDYNPDKQWIFPNIKLETTEVKKIIARVVEIATRTLFTHISYKFEGRHYKQNSGGPIGMRVTGAAAELVMQD